MKTLNHYDMADMVSLLLRKRGEGVPSREDVLTCIEKCAFMNSQTLTEEDILKIENIIETNMSINMDVGSVIIDIDTYKPWLSNRKSSIHPYFWNRYRKFLLEDKGRPENIVATLDRISDEVLDFLGNPAEPGCWKRKGLLLGDIQSGKTQSYNALINKAADAGYKLIIVLSGIQEALRKQTQERIDNDFIGLNSNSYLNNRHERFIGVGKINKNIHAFPVTNIDSDFNIQKLKAHIHSARSVDLPIIFVIKKNATVLNYLYKWLENSYMDSSSDKIDKPLLLIDDEADNASINTSQEDQNPTKINESIRKILYLFNRSSYLAVTATPFANIFINPDGKFDDKDDLFPSDFIYSLSSPSNYIGCNAIFGDNACYDYFIETIDDADGYFKSNSGAKHQVLDLPQSLYEAINYFLLCNVIRDLNGIKNDHRSMLVNVSQYTMVQETLFELITIYLSKIQNDISAYSGLTKDKALQIDSIKQLEKVWIDKKLNKVIDKDFHEVLPILKDSILPVTATMINTKTKLRSLERLDYEKYKSGGLRAIVVGGNSLSRGLTLEGLCVSYFFRESKMYDTLLQMGRWFGYRTGYDSIVKIWMSERTIDWFEFISEACEELRNEIAYMNKLNQTPREFGLKVLEHPGTLMVTAANKMRTAESIEVRLALSGKIRTSSWLSSYNIEKNLNFTEVFLNKIVNKYDQLKNRLYFGIPSDLISDFICGFSTHNAFLSFNSNEISKYIDKNRENLKKWYVYISQGSEVEDSKIAGITINRNIRKMEIIEDCIKISGNKLHLGSGEELTVLLETQEIVRARDTYIDFLRKHGKYSTDKKLTIPDHILLQFIKHPVLMIYFIKSKPDQVGKISHDILGDKTIVAIRVGFPRFDEKEEEPINYKINLVEQKNLRVFFNVDDMEGDENEDN